MTPAYGGLATTRNGWPGQRNAADVQLEHRDPEPAKRSRRAAARARVELDREHPAARSCEGAGQGAVAGPEVDDDVTGADG